MANASVREDPIIESQTGAAPGAPSPRRPRARPSRLPRPGDRVAIVAGTGSPVRPANLLAYPYMSIAERDRRWALLRNTMAEAKLEALVLPPSDPHLLALHADLRYLTHVGGIGDATVAAVFPRTGEPIAIAQDAAQWLECQPWMTELREAAGNFGEAMRLALREIRLRRGRVGVARLAAESDAWNAEISDGFMHVLESAYPAIEWVDFSAPLDALRSIKSAEEIAFLERSAAILATAFDETAAAMRPAIRSSDLWGALVEGICRAGSDLPPPPFWAAGISPTVLSNAPTRDEIAPGWLVLADAAAAWGGYRAMAAQTFSYGAPGPEESRLMAFLSDGWSAAVALLRGGIALGDAEAAMLQAVQGASSQSVGGRAIDWEISLRGCGLGADIPRRIANRIQPADVDRKIAPGWCLAVSVSATLDGHRLIWGDTIAISASGPRVLSQRTPSILVGGTERRHPAPK